MRSLYRRSIVLATLSILGVAHLSAITLKKETDRKKAPDFELKDSQGQVVRLSDYAGRVILLDFWATWCVPCKSSMPWFDELSKKYQVAGLTVLGVSIDSEGWDAVKPFLDKIRITYPIVVATQRVTYLYGDVDTVPLAFFIDRNQRVAAIHLGEASRKEFENTIKVLLAAPVGTGVGRLR